jgi:ribosomal protein L11 methyltransferase
MPVAIATTQTIGLDLSSQMKKRMGVTKNKKMWLELSLQSPVEYVEPLSVVFRQYSEGAVAIEQMGGHNPDEDKEELSHPTAVLRCYLPVDSTTSDRKERIRIAVDLISRLCNLPAIEERYLEEGEWLESWKKHFSVLHFGDIVICPTWKDYSPQPQEKVINLDPGMAFGTGHHPTTKLCLEILSTLISTGDNVLDIGTGSGILAITAAKLGANSILALDTDPVAIKTAQFNSKTNKVANNIEFKLGTLDSSIGSRNFDLIVANIYASIIIEMLPRVINCLKPAGHFVLSGIPLDKEKEVYSALDNLDITGHEIRVDDGWIAITGNKV